MLYRVIFSFSLKHKIMIIESITQTCMACPSQWEGNLIDGRMFYARYRWGRLTIELSKKPTNDVYMAMLPDGELICDKGIGDSLDGVLEQSKLEAIMMGLGFVFN